jgi:hypothetical protein
MWIKRFLRRLMLCFALAGHSFLGARISKEKIEELMYSVHQPRAEATITDENGKDDAQNASYR